MGAGIGGPIVKDKTFIFASYEGTYANADTLDLTTVPTAGALAGNFSGVPGLTIYQPGTGINGANRVAYAGNRIPSSALNPAAVSIAAALPSPNLPGFNNNYLATDLARDHVEKWDGRVDQHFTDRTSGFVRFDFSNDHALAASPLGAVVGATNNNALQNYNSAIDLTHEFGPRVIADARFDYNRYQSRLFAASNSAALAGHAGFGTGFAGNLASIQIAGMAPIGASPFYPENGVDNTFQWATNWNLIAARHDIKWGVDVRRIRSDGFTETPFGTMFGPNGTFVFGPGATLTSNGAGLSPYGEFYNSFAAFLTGSPSQYGISNFLTSPTIRQSEYSAWVGDKLQFFHRLTIDLGLRYEVYSPLAPRNNDGASFFNSPDNTFNFAGVNNGNYTAYRYDLDNFAPRFGYALRLSSKTTLRGGYGISYFQVPYTYSGFLAPTYGFANGAAGSYAVASLATPFNGTLTNTAAVPVLTGATAAGNLPAAVVPRNLQTPYVQSFSTEIQQEFFWGTVLDAGYVGSLGRELPFIEELNASMPGTGVAGLPFYALGRTASTLFFDNSLTDNYNSLQVKLGKRFSKGLSFNGSYTYAKALGYTTGSLMLLNPFNLRSNYGPQDWDRQHILTISHLWAIPFGMNGKSMAATILGGWQINGIFNWATGMPLTITADPLTCNCTGYSPSVNLLGTASGYMGGGNFVLNPGAFALAAPGTFGNLGRGSFRGPNLTDYDLSVFKNFKVYEKFNLQLRAEAYNLLNSKQTLSPLTNFSSPSFGQTTGTIFGAFGRQVNLALRVTF